MKKGVLYFYKDKPFYVSAITSLYLGVSLLMFTSISLIGQGVVIISSLVFTGSIVRFFLYKKQTAQSTAWPFLIFILAASSNFYTYLLSNINLYSVLFIIIHISFIGSFCVLYYQSIQKNRWHRTIRYFFFSGLLSVFLYLIGVRQLTFWNGSAIILFSIMQAMIICPTVLIIQRKPQFETFYEQLEDSFFTGKTMIILSGIMLLILFIWDLFYLFLLYRYIVKILF